MPDLDPTPIEYIYRMPLEALDQSVATFRLGNGSDAALVIMLPRTEWRNLDSPSMIEVNVKAAPR